MQTTERTQCKNDPLIPIAHRKALPHRGLGLLAFALGIAWSNLTPAMTLSERIDCTRAVESVNWAHRIWPEVNIGPKPPLDAVFPGSAALAVAEDSVKMSQVLESRYGRRIDASVLRRELLRMAVHTKAPDQLQAMFDVVGNDASRAAECLARPQLARRWLVESFEQDQELHGRVLVKAQSAAASRAVHPPEGVVPELVTFVRQPSGALSSDSGATAASDEIVLNEMEWQRQLDSLGLWSTTSSSMQRNGRGAGIDPKDLGDAFVVERVKSVASDRLVVELWRFPKIGFNEWWRDERNRHTGILLSASIKEALPVIDSARVAHKFGPDEWRTLQPRTPSARQDHTMIWTGSEMIVWGGSDVDDGLLNSGGRYHPATDTWFATPLAGSPAPMKDHTAVWTGTEMIVWGRNVTQISGRYNPVTDSWTSATMLGAPSARNSHSAVWTGSVMVVWGGHPGGVASSLNTGGRYDPVADSWTPTSNTSAPEGRDHHAVVWTGSEMIVWGGQRWFDETSVRINSGARYNPVSDSWIATPTLNAPTARTLQPNQAVWTGSEMVIWGGSDAGGLSNTGARFNPVTNLWSPMSTVNRPSGRASHSTVWSGTDVIVWGGSNPLSGAKYRPANDSWAPMASLGAPPNAVGQLAIWTGEEMIIWGGRIGSVVTQLGGRYTNLTNTWIPTSVNHPPKRREQHTATWTGAEMVIWGGAQFGSIQNYSHGLYHAATDTWLPVSISGSAEKRIRAASVWTGSQVMVWGGVNVSGIRQNTGVLYNPATDSWTATSITAAPAAREDHTMVWSGQEVIIWAGTLLGGTRTQTGARYLPSSNTWLPTSVTNPPSARQGHTAVWTGSEMLIWGGRDSAFTNTGGRYNPTTDAWQTMTTTGAPVPRELHSAVWTGADMIVWGGQGNGARLNSGGRFNAANSSWSDLTLVGAPDPRQEHTAVWTGEEMIVWGGWRFDVVTIFPSAGGRYFPATDSWTATAQASAPDGRRFHTAVWTGEAMLIWGGENVNGDNSDEAPAYYPNLSKQATETRLASISPSPSTPGEPVTVSVLVSAVATAPVNGSVNVVASTGESCADASPTATWVNSSTFTCVIVFSTAGSRLLTASFFGSSTHKDSGGPARQHVVVAQDELFANGFEN